KNRPVVSGLPGFGDHESAGDLAPGRGLRERRPSTAFTVPEPKLKVGGFLRRSELDARVSPDCLQPSSGRHIPVPRVSMSRAASLCRLLAMILPEPGTHFQTLLADLAGQRTLRQAVLAESPTTVPTKMPRLIRAFGEE